MPNQNEGNPSTASDNEADLGAAVTATQPFALEDWARDEQCLRTDSCPGSRLKRMHE